MAFRVGQKVVCVEDGDVDGEGTDWGKTEAIHKGQIYTVKRYYLGPFGRPNVWLKEVARDETAIRHYGPDAGYLASRFRPIQERKQSTETGMTILRGLLKTQKVDA